MITNDPAVLAEADKMVLPGVGAFEDCHRRAAAARSWSSRSQAAIDAGKPFLGICLGLQLLFDVGYEGGRHEGLGDIPRRGRAVRRAARVQSAAHGLERADAFAAVPPVLDGIADGTHVYFVHSYYVVPQDRAWSSPRRPTTTVRSTSAIWRDNVFATQFHPEKSQSFGLRMLKNFAELA